ncbi:MAG: CorA family divalent cation transporter [Chitinophagales bacterium]|jgi:magnesium transporter|nr:magnesium transporter CorA [Sphingobacteriales bacterium]
MAITEYSIDNSKFQWIDVLSPNESELLALGQRFSIHPYSIKDCLEPEHLPKFESQEGYHFIISRLLIEHQTISKVHTIQQATSKLAIFYNEKFIITIHRLHLDFIQEVKLKYFDTHRCHAPSDMAVRLLWHVLKSYDNPSLKLAEEIDIYEEQIFLKSLSPLLMKNLYFLKRRTHIAHKLLQMTTNVVQSLQSKDKVALQDLRDTQIQLQSVYAQCLEDVNNLLHFYMSISSQKTNEVMRILTVFSAFFLPLTFIVGIYGMNFKFMPELEHIHGYKLTWILMILITVIIFQWFWRKKWL